MKQVYMYLSTIEVVERIVKLLQQTKTFTVKLEETPSGWILEVEVEC